MMKRPLVGAALCAATILGLGTTAFAGEVNGKGEYIGAKDHARSECVYSGLNDEPFQRGGGEGASVQNWGHVEDDPFFGEIVSSKGASEVEVYLNFGGEPVLVTIGCNPHAGGGEG